MHVAKMLSSGGTGKGEAATAGIRQILGIRHTAKIPARLVEQVRMGTTVATNALLERKGSKVALVVTAGFKDILAIGDQSRPELFDLFPRRPAQLARRVLEVRERIHANGAVEQKLDERELKKDLAKLRGKIDSVAIVCVHGYRHPAHERRIAKMCEQLRLPWIFCSSTTEAVSGLVRRGETTLMDAYLTPILCTHVAKLSGELGDIHLRFMQSNGGLTGVDDFSGCRAVLSGPAGGAVGAIALAKKHGLARIVSLDMGGTSTDVAHSTGGLERTIDAKVAGMALATPMLRINTVAAGGGSIVWHGAGRLQVGPQSAGSEPGPACYGRGGPVTVTDCNLALGRLVPGTFPKVFGAKCDGPLDEKATRRQLARLGKRVGEKNIERLAEACLNVAIERMVKALKSISVQRGHDLRKGYALVAFGGAGGQHACQIAKRAGIAKVLIHPLAGVMSAAGIGLASMRALRQQTLEIPLVNGESRVKRTMARLVASAKAELRRQNASCKSAKVTRNVRLRYCDSSSDIAVELASARRMRAAFAVKHKQIYGFARPRVDLVIAGVEAEAMDGAATIPDSYKPRRGREKAQMHAHRIFVEGGWRDAVAFHRRELGAGERVVGPALILEDTATTYVDDSWKATTQADGSLLLAQLAKPRAKRKTSRGVLSEPSPDRLEVFNSMFMSTAEQMGHVLRNTASSVNIKERLDYSCAVFDSKGGLVANAPHIPVHLGSMGATVTSVLRANHGKIRPGDAWLVNAPYAGGTHLPDLTVVAPVFRPGFMKPRFFVCSRGHHADVGGLTPGSMPAHSQTLDQEGVVFDNFKVVSAGKLEHAKLLAQLGKGRYPARSPQQNVADLLAQLAATAKGEIELQRICDEQGDTLAGAYMGHIQDNAANAVKELLPKLRPGSHEVVADNAAKVCVAVRIGRGRKDLTFDFAGTSGQQDSCFNAPPSVTTAAVYYVMRCLLQADIPLNAGVLRHVRLKLPAGSMINPARDAAVAAGNVEVSQMVVDALLGALKVSAGAQGTMNNLTFGNSAHQYYETICGGGGAGPAHAGARAVHTHMTNTRITDVEVLEDRYPVILERFAVRNGSGGAGRHSGGPGVIRRLRFNEPMAVTMLANRRSVPPAGQAGGSDGACGQNWVQRNDGLIDKGDGAHIWQAQKGDVLEVRTPGGGGWGRPPSSKRSKK